MDRFIPFALSCCILVVPVSAAAQDEVKINLKRWAQGDTGRVTSTYSYRQRTKIVDSHGNVQEQEDKEEQIADYTETILKRVGVDWPTQVERAYTSLRWTKNDTVQNAPLVGKTVLIERKGNCYFFTFKRGQEVPESAAEFLRQEFYESEEPQVDAWSLLLPRHPVKVGAIWKLDLKPIFEEFRKSKGFEVDANAEGTGTLLRIYKKDGRQFGLLQFKIAGVIKSLTLGSAEFKFAEGAKLVADTTLDTCLDGSSWVETKKINCALTGEATLPAQPGFTVTVDGRGTWIYSAQESAKTNKDKERKQ